ncbi:MAG TPA: hypothetical protein VLK58_11375 [Conexibacter sp.]|nr:hypothetical protein [Conexibacter sp.]
MPARIAASFAVLLSVLVLSLVASGAASAAAAAPMKSCKSVSGRAGGVDQIRVTKSFSCREARRSIGGWLNLFQQSGPPPWTCTSRGASVMRWRCRVRTSFGGTRPLRLYRLNFRLLDA